VARALVGDAVRMDAISAAARDLLDDPKPREIARGVAAEIAEMPAPEVVLAEVVAWAS
jgi:hypothetical protein